MSISLQHVYGMEFAAGLVTVVRLDRTRRSGNPVVLAAGLNPERDPAWPDIAAAIIREQARGIAMVSVPVFAHDSFIRPVEAPLASVSKARAVFPSLLDVQLPFPLEQCAWQFTGLSKSAQGHVRALAVAVPLERINQTLESFRPASIDPEWLDQESLALWRFSRKQRAIAAGCTRVVLYLGLDRTVAVVGNAREPLATVGARTAWSADTDAAARDKLVVRLRQFLAGALRNVGESTAEFVVAGPGAEADTAILRDALDVHADKWKPVESPSIFLAHALADGLRWPENWTANLRHGNLVHPNLVRNQERRNNRVCLLTAAASLFLIVSSWNAVHVAARHHDRLQADIRTRAMTLTGNPAIPRGQEVFIAGRFVEDAAGNYLTFQQWLEPSAYPGFARLLREAKVRNVAIESATVRSGSVLVRGVGADWDDPELMVGHLAQAGWNVNIERSDAGSDERIPFVVRAQQ